MNNTYEQFDKHLSDLEIGKSCRVIGINERCNGLERRRLLDLGILPGTLIKAELQSPSGDPIAYRIRDTIIGLRKEQTCLIEVVM